ncbi:TonB-dependent receptor [Niastella caeni]|uniref:TonB-dependent receptor n=1 Tax=Niastella caeni TaxID=2569763 RepID=A0A4S8HDB3_9BACT|nr:TonB-dependent receptor [Niastella caeni]THU33028.1 TonB-dependent receptor [Niastella caeni]
MKLTVYCAPWQLNRVPCSNEHVSGKTPPANWWLPAKMLLIMKLTAFLLLVISLHVSARGLSQKITIVKKNATLEQIFELIQQQGGYDFLVSSQVLAKAHRVDIEARNATVKEVLDQCFKNQPLTYILHEKTIIVKEKEKKEEKSTAQAVTIVSEPEQKASGSGHVTTAYATTAQTVSGTVKDEKNQPIEGAAVSIKKLNIGTITDHNGKFQFTVPDGAWELEISSVGYQPITRTITVGESAVPTLNVSMKLSATGLTDVVVVGYGTQRKRDVTGTISRVKGEDFQNLPVTNAAQALQGRASGVDIVSGDGAPNSTPAIRIRGTGTLNSADPLVVIDGVPAGSLTDVNPNDIASIEVLKDASSSAIYGTRAANGVILVTTKKGNYEEKLKININAYTGQSKVLKKLDLLTAPDLVKLKKEEFNNDGSSIPAIWNDPNYAVQRTNWQDALFGTGKVNNADASLRGGNRNSNFSLSGNYYDNKGMIQNSFFRRYSARFNSEHKIGGRIKVGENFLYSSTNDAGPNTRSAQDGLVWSAIRFNPAIPVKKDDGTWGSSKADNELGDINNPVFTAANIDQSNRNSRVLANAYAEIEILKNLKFRANFGFDQTLYNYYNFSIATPDQTRVNSLAILTQSSSKRTSLLEEYYLTWDGKFGKDHNLSVVGGYSAQNLKSNWFTAERRGYDDANRDQRVLNSGSSGNQFSSGNNNPDEGLVSYFARANYGFKGKYLLTATMRADGSSKFPKGKQWGYFPAFSAGWRISDENFFKDNVSFINSLKITGGWGQLGNQNVPAYQYLGIVTRGGSSTIYAFGTGTTVVDGAFITSLGNPEITWERAEMTNISLEFATLHNKLTGTVTWFNKNTKDMLIPYPLVETYGAGSGYVPGGVVIVPNQNIGTLNNKGVEVELGYQDKVGELGYSVSVNAAFIKNKVTKLYGNNKDYIGAAFYGRQSLETSRTYEGQPIASFYGYKTGGLYQNQSDIDKDPNITNDPNKANIKPGDVRFIDQNGDGIIDGKDRVNLGDPNPGATYGINGSAWYKGFDCSFSFSGVMGVELYNADRMAGLDGTQVFNMYQEALGRWHGEGTSNSIPRLSRNNANQNNRSSDLWIEKGNYLALKNISLGYTFRKLKIADASLPDTRVYVSCYNAFILTPYSGYTPELGYTDGNRQRGVDVAQYPPSRTLMIGASFNF